MQRHTLPPQTAAAAHMGRVVACKCHARIRLLHGDLQHLQLRNTVSRGLVIAAASEITDLPVDDRPILDEGVQLREQEHGKGHRRFHGSSRGSRGGSSTNGYRKRSLQNQERSLRVARQVIDRRRQRGARSRCTAVVPLLLRQRRRGAQQQRAFALHRVWSHHKVHSAGVSVRRSTFRVRPGCAPVRLTHSRPDPSRRSPC
jgi:hypothetical protein